MIFALFDNSSESFNPGIALHLIVMSCCVKWVSSVNRIGKKKYREGCFVLTVVGPTKLVWH